MILTWRSTPRNKAWRKRSICLLNSIIKRRKSSKNEQNRTSQINAGPLSIHAFFFESIKAVHNTLLDWVVLSAFKIVCVSSIGFEESHSRRMSSCVSSTFLFNNKSSCRVDDFWILIAGKMRRSESDLSKLEGAEVKQLRLGNCNLKDSFCILRNGELTLKNLHIPVYEKAPALS